VVQQQPGKPANICQELMTFLRQPVAAVAQAAPPTHQATAVQAPSPGQTAPQPHAAGGQAQQSSGMSGPVTQGGPGAPGPQGQAQNNPAAQQAGQGAPPAATPSASPQQAAAPAPTAAPAPAPAATPEQIQRIETAAGADDIKSCRDVAQQMRRAGVKLPDPLIALAALDLKFLESVRQP
jgi:hypothetical protein